MLAYSSCKKGKQLVKARFALLVISGAAVLAIAALLGLYAQATETSGDPQVAPSATVSPIASPPLPLEDAAVPPGKEASDSAPMALTPTPPSGKEPPPPPPPDGQVSGTCPEGIQPQMTLRLTGPSEGKPGEQLPYDVAYELVDESSAEIRFAWGQAGGPSLEDVIAYVSSERLSGSGAPGAIASLLEGGLWQVIWPIGKGTGTVKLTLEVPRDAKFDSFQVVAYVPGTCAPASNAVTTTIVR